jgi:hypothetical protein
MKKSILLPFILFISCFSSFTALAQDLSFEIKTDTVVSNGTPTGAIQVSVLDGDGPFVYILFTKEPWDGGKELARSPETRKTNWKFSGLNAGSYLVCVQDAGKNSVLQFAVIPARTLGFLPLHDQPGVLHLLSFDDSQKTPIE